MSAPALYCEKLVTKEIAVAGWLISENIQNVVAVNMPVFSHRKFKLYLETTHVMAHLCKPVLDQDFHLLFKDRTDDRDDRPLTYPGKLLLPSHLVDIKNSIWWRCTLSRKGRTDEVTNLKLKYQI